MSYILEALKKAQAERQIGSTPTIHAAQVVTPLPAGATANRKPLFIGLGAGALVVVAGAVVLWRPAPGHAPAHGPASVAVASRAPAPAPDAARAADEFAVSAPPVAAPEPAPVRASTPAPAATPAPAPTHVPASARMAGPAVAATGAAPSRPAPPASASAPASVAGAGPAVAASGAARFRPAAPAPASAPASARVAGPAVAASGVAPSRPAAPALAPEDSLPFLQQLPDARQRDIPRVTFGGYMYSSNPSDRLLIVDKALRHEGEEVAPGLVLEKLLPKAAVMNYRGTRYRVPY